MRSPRLRFPPHDRPLRSILVRLLHHTGTVCERTFWFLDLPFRFHPHPDRFYDSWSNAILDVAVACANRCAIFGECTPARFGYRRLRHFW